jgi:hypothetical protein
MASHLSNTIVLDQISSPLGTHGIGDSDALVGPFFKEETRTLCHLLVTRS